MPARETARCAHGREPESCCVTDIAGVLSKGLGGDGHNRLCPAHDDREASLSINPGTKGMRIVWHCGAGCDPADIRAALLDLGVDESCLGGYMDPERRHRAVVPGMRVGGDPGMVADAKRWQAMLKLPAGLNAKLRQMCVQAIAEGDGDLPGDPDRLLPRDKSQFVALAERAGIERTYRYKLWEQFGREA